MEFRTQYDRLEQPIYTNPGEQFHQTLRARFDDKGNYELVKDEVIDVQAQIDSWKDSVDLNLILQRYSNGDTSALEKYQASYGDFTGLPKNMIDAMNFFNDGKDVFDHLPLDVREKFGFNFGQYLAQFGTDEWLEKMDMKEKIATPVVEDKKEGIE